MWRFFIIIDGLIGIMLITLHWINVLEIYVIWIITNRLDTRLSLINWNRPWALKQLIIIDFTLLFFVRLTLETYGYGLCDIENHVAIPHFKLDLVLPHFPLLEWAYSWVPIRFGCQVLILVEGIQKSMLLLFLTTIALNIINLNLFY